MICQFSLLIVSDCLELKITKPVIKCTGTKTLVEAGQRVVGLITENIATGATGTALTLGRIITDTDLLTPDIIVQLTLNNGVYGFADSNNSPERAMGLVITSAETGTLLVDTLTVPINNSAAATSLEALNDVDVGTAAGLNFSL